MKYQKYLCASNLYVYILFFINISMYIICMLFIWCKYVGVFALPCNAVTLCVQPATYIVTIIYRPPVHIILHYYIYIYVPTIIYIQDLFHHEPFPKLFVTLKVLLIYISALYIYTYNILHCHIHRVLHIILYMYVICFLFTMWCPINTYLKCISPSYIWRSSFIIKLECLVWPWWTCSGSYLIGVRAFMFIFYS